MKLWNKKWLGNLKDGNSSEKTVILNFFDLTAIGVGSSVAVGVSVLIGELIKNGRGPGPVISIVLAGITAFFAALCLAEFGVRFLKANSAYVFCYSRNRENVAFIFGWALILEYVAGAASVARGIITFIDALTENNISNFLEEITWKNVGGIFPYFDVFSLAIVIVLMGILIVLGMKESTPIRNIFTLCNIIVLISVIIAGSFKADKKNWEPPEDIEESGNFLSFSTITKGAAIAFYGYIGFDAIDVTGNEVKKRKKNIPLAMVATIVITLLAYTGTGIILTLMCPSQMHNANAALPFAFEQVGWPAVKWVVAVTAFFGFQTSLFGVTFPLHRIIYTMANDGLLFAFLGNKHPQLKTPVVAVVVGGILTSLAAAAFPFQKLVNLTVIGTLFVYTIIAFNVILLRYTPIREKEEPLAENWMNQSTMKKMLKNCFGLGEDIPSNLTEKIVGGNLILFCFSSIGISVIFIFFPESIFSLSAEAVVPASLLVCLMFLNLVSITCQPKLNCLLPFEVPLIPFIPCLSIFLNIFLMLTLESLTWILFSIWMAVGVIPHLTWYSFKRWRNQVGENSLYEINKTNAVKLNESIWKIKSDKKSFYEGAVNPVFSDDTFDEIRSTPSSDRKLELKKAEIHTTNSVLEETIDTLENDREPGSDKSNQDDVPGEGKIYWECVAEIHTEFPQESVVLEIVDNTYNFLSEEPEESIKDETSERNSDDFKPEPETDEQPRELTNTAKSFQEELVSKIKELKNKNINKKPPENIENTGTSDINLEEGKYVNLIVESWYETQKKEPLIGDNKSSPEEVEVKPEEQNKIKAFKQKLNELLKNQMNNSPTNNFFQKPNNSTDAEEPKNGSVVYKSIKTLNKSQVKNKLELLLAKGPPIRPSLSSSFNIKLKDTDDEIELDKSQDDKMENSPPNGNDTTQNTLPNGDHPRADISPLQNIILETKLTLKNVNTEVLDSYL